MADPIQNHQREATARAEAQDFRPWEELGNFRRDCEPHRAVFLTRLADLAWYLGLLSVPFCLLIVPAFLALALSVGVYLLARHDLLLIEQRMMDSVGEPESEDAQRTAIDAVLYSLVSACVGMVGIVVIICLCLSV